MHQSPGQCRESSLPPLQVRRGVLRSEYQKNASRTIKETVELQKRNKERDKDKERLQSQNQQSVVVALPEPGPSAEGRPAVSQAFSYSSHILHSSLRLYHTALTCMYMQLQ